MRLGGKYTRVDKQGASGASFCMKATIAFFVGMCILAVWMMNSSSSEVPAERENFNAARKMSPDKGNVSPNLETPVTKKEDPAASFEDNPGDLPADAIKGDESSDDAEKKTVTEENNTEEESKKEEENKSEENKEEENKTEENKEEENKTEENKEEDSSKTEKVEDKTNDQNEENKSNDEKVEGGLPKPDESEAEKEINSKIDSLEKEQQQQIAAEKNPSQLPEVFPNGGKAELLKEKDVEPGNWETQAAESKGEKERQEAEKGAALNSEGSPGQSLNASGNQYQWKLCSSSAGMDYIPCLDNIQALKKLPSTNHFQHRERHCPEQAPTCLVPLPQGYKMHIKWPESRNKIWFNNVPHTKLAEYKKTQNWVKVEGEYSIFPGGGTQFVHGALRYIDFIEETIPDIAWGNRTRVVLDVGCGVASFGGYLFDRQTLTMSLAPKDEHEAQVQLALERGIPAISAVMGTQRLSFPSGVFDVVHCARCRVRWHADGGMLLLELNRMLRPGGFFVWSATPVYRTNEEDSGIWKEMSALTASICWNLISKKYDDVNEVGVAIYQKPTSNECYESRRKNEPPLCQEKDDPDAAWYVPMESCLHKVPTEVEVRGTEWPEIWPQRVESVPSWLKGDVRNNFVQDNEYWKTVVGKSYLTTMGIDWSNIRNVMDMKAIYGGFAAALASQPLWVMNIVPIDAPNTLPIIYERGLFGIHHDWCESFSTYPRTYDLLHADHLFTKLKERCNLLPVIVEVDRILRPGGSVIFRDAADTLNEIESIIKSLHYEVRMTFAQNNESIMYAVKTMWRPES